MMDLKKEQKDVGKLKENNERLKQEMASLRAMLAAQAKESAAGDAHKKELEEKEARIAELEKKIAEIEKELAAAKLLVDKLEADLKAQAEESSKDKDQIQQLRNRQLRRQDAPGSPRHNRKVSSSSFGSGNLGHLAPPSLEGVPADYVSPEVLAQHRAKVAILEEELEAERRLRREADGEIIKLRAAINGVKLNEDDVNALLAPQLGGASAAMSEESSYSDEELPSKRYVWFIFSTHVFDRWCRCVVCLVRRV